MRSFVAIAGPFDTRLSCAAFDRHRRSAIPRRGISIGRQRRRLPTPPNSKPGPIRPDVRTRRLRRGRRPGTSFPVPNPMVSADTVPTGPRPRRSARATERNRLCKGPPHRSQPPARPQCGGLGRWFPAGSDHLDSRRRSTDCEPVCVHRDGPSSDHPLRNGRPERIRRPSASRPMHRQATGST